MRARPPRRSSPSDQASLSALRSPGVPKGPRAFCFLYAPLAEAEYARASEARFSGFESRVGYQIFLRESERPSPALLQLGCGKAAPPRVQRADRPRGGAAWILLAVAQRGSARRSGRRGRRFESCRRDQSGAVTQKKECPLVEREVAGSSPAGAASTHGA
jgi:hypothetical protein